MRKKQEHEAELEIKLRGSTLNVAIKFEVFLINIIYFSNSEQYMNPTESKSLKIKNLTFGGKIKRAKDLLSIYHLDLLTKYDELFLDLDNFLEFRNKLAHCAMLWVDEKSEYLEIWDVAETPEKFQFYAPITRTTREISESIIWYLNKISTPLISLQNEVQLRLKQTNLKLYSALTSALHNDNPEK